MVLLSKSGSSLALAVLRAWKESKAERGGLSLTQCRRVGTSYSRVNGISNHHSWHLLRAWKRVDFVDQSVHLHHSGVGSTHRSIHCEHALSWSSRTCHPQISAEKREYFPNLNFATKREKQKWCNRFIRSLSEIQILCVLVKMKSLALWVLWLVPTFSMGFIRVQSAGIVLPTWDSSKHPLPPVKCLNWGTHWTPLIFLLPFPWWTMKTFQCFALKNLKVWFPIAQCL